MRHASLIGPLLCGAALVLAGLWYWGDAPRLAADARAAHADMAVWSIRLAATAGFAAAQVLFLTFGVNRFCRRSRFDAALRNAVGVVFSASLAASVAFALLERWVL